MNEGLAKGLEKGLAKGLAKGRQEGRQEGMREVARNLLALNLPLPTIQETTGLSRDEILALQTENERKH
jgi:predicted transposase/invertase (TIGR01784 family)